jgi:hypothetical protein
MRRAPTAAPPRAGINTQSKQLLRAFVPVEAGALNTNGRNAAPTLTSDVHRHMCQEAPQ